MRCFVIFSHVYCRSFRPLRHPSDRSQNSDPATALQASAPAIVGKWAGDGSGAKQSARGKAAAKGGKTGVKLNAGVAHGSVS